MIKTKVAAEAVCGIDNCIPNSQLLDEVGCNFKGLRVKFAKNLRASTFNEGLSNENTFSLIYLGGQYL
jgi:hypothetical protein